MKRTIAAIVAVFALMTTVAHAGNGDLIVDGQVGVGTDAPAASAALEIASATKGLLPPRMTTAQRDAITAPVTGLLIFNTTENAYDFYTGTTWIPLGGTQAGFVEAYAGTTAPAGWLKCNGTAVSRTTYASLFAAIGTTYGDGDGSTTFNLPDLRGEFVRGWDDSRGVDAGRGIGSLQFSAVGPHDHSIDVNRNLLYSGGGGRVNDAPGTDDAYQGTGGRDRTSNPITGGANETRPRNVALMYCIKY